ncbi:SDR family NAD(P)-dependent oxidoreductase [Sorangium sp. So ce590]|uniref:type I polyketide synthase n=1 Tax=Sorangium sp. So ce590 TaxID=3133317 RepID=UPI003F61EB56
MKNMPLEQKRELLLRLIQWENAALPAKPSRPDDVAIIGLSGRYPMADDIDAFWKNLRAGRDCITEIPRDRWDHALYYDAEPGKPRKAYAKWGGFIGDVDKFDPLFFNIPPKDAGLLDPQERLFLEIVWEAFEDAGITRASLHERGVAPPVGVFVGVMYSEYHLLPGGSDGSRELVLTPSYASIANRVSHFFGFSGPSIALDTMCSSSLTAIHLACESLRSGGCELAVAGGVNLSLHPNKYLSLCEYRFASSDGRCRSFGDGGDGYVPGEGVGAVLLKLLSAAVRDGDPIYGVIKGTGVNHGGKTQGYTVPNPLAQASLISGVLNAADVDPRTISYVEAHGTGTSLGDPIEIAGLSRVFSGVDPERQVRIGSVKSNVGHLEAAAGIVAVTKVLLLLKNKQLVPSLHSDVLNPNLALANTPFRVQQQLEPWPQPQVVEGGVVKTCPRRAGISSFGAGGANAFLLVEEYLPAQGTEPNPDGEDDGPEIVVLSARNEERLNASVRRLKNYLEAGRAEAHRVSSGARVVNAALRLRDVAHTLQVGREAMEVRLACVVRSLEELTRKLGQFLDGAGERSVEELYFHDARRAGEGAPRPLRHDEQAPFGAWARNADFRSLARSWVAGAEIDWCRVWDRPRGRRISLPKYPFERRRCWLTAPPPAPPKREAPRPAAEPRSERSKAQAMFVRQTWLEQAHAPGSGRSEALGELLGRERSVLLLFGRAPSELDALKAWLSASGIESRAAILLILPGTRYRELSPEMVEIDPDSPQDYERLAGGLSDRGAAPTVVAFLWGLSLGHADVPDERRAVASKLADALRYGVRPVFFMTRAIFARYPSEPVRMAYCSPGSGEMLDVVSSHHQAVGAFLRSAAQEHPSLVFRSIQRGDDPSDARAAIGAAMTELASSEPTASAEVLLKGGRRWLRTLVRQPDERVEAAGAAPGAAVFRRGSNYLLSGGLGALGPAFVRHLVERYDARVFLLGRRSLGAADLERLLGPITRSSSVEYHRVDINDFSELRRCFAEIREQRGPLHGVLHLARSVEDRMIFMKDPASFERVIEAKLFGTINLDQVTKAENLDFFVMFSSMASITGLGGASDYAFSCAFQNGFAEMRSRLVERGIRSGVSLALSWPQWEQDAFLDPAKQARLRAAGFELLDAERGIAALERALASGCPSVSVAYGDEEKLSHLLGVAQENRVEASGAGRQIRASKAPRAPSRGEMQGWSDAQLDSYLKRLLAEAAYESHAR